MMNIFFFFSTSKYLSPLDIIHNLGCWHDKFDRNLSHFASALLL